MDMFTKRIVSVGVGFLMALGSAAPAWAVTADVQVSANVSPRTELELLKDVNSVARFTPGELVFDRYDDQDGQADGNPLFMYAPYRSETGKNWHVAEILSNGASMTLTAAVTEPVGSAAELVNNLDVFFGGFFGSDGSFSGGTSGDWELLNGFRRDLTQPFVGVCPLNYRLRLQGVPASGTPYTGQITYTLTAE